MSPVFCSLCRVLSPLPLFRRGRLVIAPPLLCFPSPCFCPPVFYLPVSFSLHCAPMCKMTLFIRSTRFRLLTCRLVLYYLLPVGCRTGPIPSVFELAMPCHVLRSCTPTADRVQGAGAHAGRAHSKRGLEGREPRGVRKGRTRSPPVPHTLIPSHTFYFGLHRKQRLQLARNQMATTQPQFAE